MTPRDRIHLAALRGAEVTVRLSCVRGKRRDNDTALYFGACWRGAWWSHDNDPEFDLSEPGALIERNGFRELCAQLHILETAEREERRLTPGKTADSI